ncbi:MAG: aminotransferase class V-fold PLP-dependent enzyme [Candidatus Nanopelagicales bacterium]
MTDAALLARLRADTPGCLTQVHLNNAGSALPPTVVVDAVVDHLRREAEIGGYEAHDEAGDRIDAVYSSLGRLVGAPASSIALTASATDSWLRAFTSIPVGAGDRLLVSEAEYASNVIPLLQVARRVGATVETIPDDADGVLDVEALRSMLDERVKLVAVTHAPSQNGLLNPAEGVGRVLRESGSEAWYLLDACQSVGQIPLDLDALGCDFLSATGRKFLRGPRGTGFLAVSPRALQLEPGLLDLHAATWVDDQEYVVAEGGRRYESWEKNYAALLGLGAAADYALDLGLDVTRKLITSAADRIRAGLAEIPGVVVRDRGTVRTGIVVFTVEGRDAGEIARAVKAAGVNVSHSAPDYALRDFRDHGIDGQVRVSPHVYTDDADIAALLAAVRTAVRTTVA